MGDKSLKIDFSRLDTITAAIKDSYKRLGGINHFEEPNLPSKKEVKNMVKALSSLLFPGFYEEVSPNKSKIEVHLHSQCSEILECLINLIHKCLKHDCKEGFKCVRSEGDCWSKASEIGFRLLESISDIREILFKDIDAAYNGDPAATNYFEIVLSYPTVQAILVHRLAHVLYNEEVPFIPRMMSEYIHGKTGIDIHPGASIAHGFFIDHGTGVVIGSTAVIGCNVKIYQHVTLGALSLSNVALIRKNNRKRHPTVEDDVTIYAGATILGGRTVLGRGAIIGGNVWLTKSVPPDTSVTFDSPCLIFRSKGKTEKHVIDYQI